MLVFAVGLQCVPMTVATKEHAADSRSTLADVAVVQVAADTGSCCAATAVVLKGQGLQILPAADGTTPVRGASDCWPGSTGMDQDTAMFEARPCDTCPRFMTTEQPLSSSRSDCKALPGYTAGSGSQPTACGIGTYKPLVGNGACTPCPANTSTLSLASTSVDNCTGVLMSALAGPRLIELNPSPF